MIPKYHCGHANFWWHLAAGAKITTSALQQLDLLLDLLGRCHGDFFARFLVALVPHLRLLSAENLNRYLDSMGRCFPDWYKYPALGFSPDPNTSNHIYFRTYSQSNTSSIATLISYLHTFPELFTSSHDGSTKGHTERTSFRS